MGVIFIMLFYPILFLLSQILLEENSGNIDHGLEDVQRQSKGLQKSRSYIR